MSDKKPTDNEIVKALNQCACSETNCYGCPYWDASNCSDRLCMDALDLINRLQAENERLEAECEEQYESAEATIRAEIASGGTSCHWCEDKVKIEAYKECIEKVKEEYADLMEFGYADISVDGLFKKLDNLLKELVGDK